MAWEIRPYEQKKSNFQKKVNFADCSNFDDSDDDQMVGSAEWVQNNKKPISCPFGNKELEKFGFDITKANKIFDLLLSEGQIKLKPYHKIQTDQELMNTKYCKWHNATSHDTKRVQSVPSADTIGYRVGQTQVWGSQKADEDKWAPVSY